MQQVVNAGLIIFAVFVVLTMVGTWWKLTVRCTNRHPVYGQCVLLPRHRLSHVNMRGQRWLR